MPSVYSSTETANQVASAFSPVDERSSDRTISEGFIKIAQENTGREHNA